MAWFQIRFLEPGFGPAQEVVLTWSSGNSTYTLKIVNIAYLHAHTMRVVSLQIDLFYEFSFFVVGSCYGNEFWNV